LYDFPAFQQAVNHWPEPQDQNGRKHPPADQRSSVDGNTQHLQNDYGKNDKDHIFRQVQNFSAVEIKLPAVRITQPDRIVMYLSMSFKFYHSYTHNNSN